MRLANYGKYSLSEKLLPTHNAPSHWRIASEENVRYLLILMTAILALAGFVIGGTHILGGLLGYAEFAGNGNLGDIAQSAGYAYADNGSRFLGSLFFSMGLGFAYCLINLSNKLLLFRFLLLNLWY
jgi:hypothetical protein